MATSKNYTISTQFTSGLNSTAMTAEVAASAVVPNLLRIQTAGGVAGFHFDGELSGADITELDTKTAAHVPPVLADFMASGKLIDGAVSITADGSWQELAGIVSDPEGIAKPLAKVVGKVIGRVKTSGSTVRLRVMEDNGTDVEAKLTTPHVLQDTSGAWEVFSFVTDIAPRTGMNVYILEGDLTAATSAELEFSSLTLAKLQQ